MKKLSLMAVLVFGGLVLAGTASAAPAAPILSYSGTISLTCGFDLNFSQASYPSGISRFQLESTRVGSGTIQSTTTDSLGLTLSGDGTKQGQTNSLLLLNPIVRGSSAGGSFYSPNTDYSVKIRAVGGDNSFSPWSSLITRNTLTLPTAPTPSTFVEAVGYDGGNGIFLEWNQDELSSYGGFEVWRSESNDGGQTYPSQQFITRLSGPDFNFYGDINVNNTKNYRYFLKSYESASGCDINYAAQRAESAFSSFAEVPAVPSGLAYSGTSGNLTVSWQDNSVNEANFRLERAYNDINGPYQTIYQTGSHNGSFMSYTDTENLGEGQYYYRVQTCTPTGCSSPSSPLSVLIVPGGGQGELFSLTSGIVSVDVGVRTANVFLRAAPISDIYVFEKKQLPGGAFAVISGCGDVNICYDTADLGKGYEYRVSINRGGETIISNTETVGLKISPILRGWAFSNVGGNGVGWIKFSKTTEAVDYGVQADQSGLLSGYAWAATDDGTGGFNWGWLSFNKGDLAGCPETDQSRCEARVSTALKSGLSEDYLRKVSGWAKFLTPDFYDVGGSVWSGWVNLSGYTNNIPNTSFLGGGKISRAVDNLKKGDLLGVAASLFGGRSVFAQVPIIEGDAYGLTYDMRNRKFGNSRSQANPRNDDLESWAWGDDIAGWIKFSYVRGPNVGVFADNSPVSLSVSPALNRVEEGGAAEFLATVNNLAADDSPDVAWSIVPNGVKVSSTIDFEGTNLETNFTCRGLECGQIVASTTPRAAYYVAPERLPGDAVALKLEVAAVSRAYPLIMGTARVEVDCRNGTCVTIDPSSASLDLATSTEPDQQIQPGSGSSKKLSQRFTASVYRNRRADPSGVDWLLSRKPGILSRDDGFLNNVVLTGATYNSPEEMPTWTNQSNIGQPQFQLQATSRVEPRASSTADITIIGPLTRVERRVKEVNP